MSYEPTMDGSSLAGSGCDSATADHAGEVARPPLLETAPGEPSGGERAAGSDRDRGSRGYRSQDEQTKRLGKALLSILRYQCSGQWLSSAELVGMLYRWHSEQEVVAVLREDPTRFVGRPRAPPDIHGWTEYEYRAKPKPDSRNR